MENNGREVFIETLTQSCNIGTYSTLSEEDYTFSCKARSDCTVMSLKFDTLDKFRSKFEELDFYLLEYEGFIEANGAPYCDFLIYRPKKTFVPIDVFISGAKRMEAILKSYSRKIEFGDLLKRIQETIRKDRAKEKQQKRKKFDDENKQVSQVQQNGKMIVELKNEMKKMYEYIEIQSEMIQELAKQRGEPQENKEIDPENDMNLEESRVSMHHHGFNKPYESMMKIQDGNSHYGAQSYAPDYTNQWE